MLVWILAIAALAAGIWIGWAARRRRAPGEIEALRRALDTERRSELARVEQQAADARDALGRDAESARAQASQREEELRGELEEARASDEAVRQELARLEDHLSEQAARRPGRTTRRNASGTRRPKRPRDLKTKSEELERLQKWAAQSRQELAAAKAEAQQTAEALGKAQKGSQSSRPRRAGSGRSSLRQRAVTARAARRSSASRCGPREAPAAETAGDVAARQRPPATPTPESSRPQTCASTRTSASGARGVGRSTVLDALDADRNLNAGQRETIRSSTAALLPRRPATVGRRQARRSP